MKERPITFTGPMVRAILEGRKTQDRKIIKPQPYYIKFTGPMVRAILEGQKTQTRRKIKPQPDYVNALGVPFYPDSFDKLKRRIHGGPVDYRINPYGQAGDRLWVRETWDFLALDDGVFDIQDFIRKGGKVAYKADGGNPVDNWIPSIHMPRRASRITLEIVSVRVERLQDISEADAKAEGVDPYAPDDGRYAEGYHELWESINGQGSWELNPWVWVIEFKKL